MVAAENSDSFSDSTKGSLIVRFRPRGSFVSVDGSDNYFQSWGSCGASAGTDEENGSLIVKFKQEKRRASAVSLEDLQRVAGMPREEVDQAVAEEAAAANLAAGGARAAVVANVRAEPQHKGRFNFMNFRRGWGTAMRGKGKTADAGTMTRRDSEISNPSSASDEARDSNMSLGSMDLAGWNEGLESQRMWQLKYAG